MNIALHQPFSVSETSTGVRYSDNIYPNTVSVSNKNRLFISCGGDSPIEALAGQVICDAIYSYFNSFLNQESDITPSFVEKAIRFAEISLDSFKKENRLEGLATSMSLLFIASDKVLLSQIGKSHIYQIRKNNIIYKSIDSSPDKKISGTKKAIDVNTVQIKDVKAEDDFFIYTGEFANKQDEEAICSILSQHASAEDKLNQIKKIYFLKYPTSFSAHLVPIRDIQDKGYYFKKKVNELVCSFV